MKPGPELPPGGGPRKPAPGGCGCRREVDSPSASLSDSPPARRLAGGGGGRRVARVAGWVMPGTMLALMPKCPACLAAYIALATGLGISISAAAVLRSSLIVVCVVALVVLSLRLVRRWLAP